MKMMLVIFLIFVFSYGIGKWLVRDEAESITVYQSTCDPAISVCVVKNQRVDYQIKFVGEPSALKPFSVVIQNYDELPQSVEIEFIMDSMDMGYNIYQMKQQKALWVADVLLPVCSLGRNDWKLKVKINYKSDRHLSEFSFRQITN